MAETALDTAHAAMQAADDDAAARLRFYEKLAGSELYLLLESEPEGDAITPQSFALSGASYVLAFDREDRLGRFTGASAPYAALSGRAIADLLAPHGLGLGLNLDVAPSAILIPPDAIAWLSGVAATPAEVTARIEELRAPAGLPETLLASLDARLAAAAGLADFAYLVAVTYDTGGQGHLLGFVGAQAPARQALASSVAQALAFSGLEAGTIDVGFFEATDPMAARLARAGLRFDLPRPERVTRSAPGSDPGQPPRLR